MSQRTLFLTGGTGFIGRRVAAALAESPEVAVRALVRHAGGAGDRVTEVVGDLGNSATYRAALEDVDCVIHLAALTGAATDDAHMRVNAEGTRALVEACKIAGVARFVLVSTIAVTYPDLSHYAYGRSKRDAEAIVRDSGLDFFILRPTIVIGPDSPIWQKLSGLAALPVMPLLGGTRVRVQPVWVDDVARAIVAAAMAETAANRTIDVGGPESLTFADFMRRIRRARTGREGPALPIPLAPLLPMIGMLEKISGGRSPVTRGQFSAFI
jgi:nucleoside-diphosphate-sugar epimerase